MDYKINFYSFVAFDNNFDTDDRAWVPEVWAQEALITLEENMVVGRLVHTDFKDEVKDFGDVVNTRKPGEFVAKRKGVNDDVTVQSATADRVQVPLNQHVHTSFLIRDSEQSRSMKDLIDEYVKPAAASLARHIDQILLGQVYQYLGNTVGDLGDINSTVGDDHNAKKLILEVRNVQNKNKAPVSGRNFILTPDTETSILDLDLFVTADKVGDEGSALREASLGRKLGYNFFMAQNTPSVTDTGVVDADDIAAASKGATVVTSDDAGTAGYAVGQYVYFGETDDKAPYRITAISGNNLTLNRGLRRALVNNTDAYLVPMGAVALTEHTAAGGPDAYPSGYDGEIWVDGTGVPQVGQLVSFNNGATPLAAEYCIITVEDKGTEYAITLDRPLEAALADGYTVGYGCGGNYNFAFTRGALALVNRPLALPKVQGVTAGVASYNDLSMRVTMTYNGEKQGVLVTLDLLCGVKVLDEDQGAILIA